MKISLHTMFQTPGEKKSLSLDIPVESLAYLKGVSFATALHVEGIFENRAGVVTLKYTVSGTQDLICDRCLKAFTRDFSYSFVHTIVAQLENETDAEDEVYLVAEEENLDLTEVVVTDLLLELPTKTLCREDCKGLCPICGCNWNESVCNCLERETTEGVEEDGSTEE